MISSARTHYPTDQIDDSVVRQRCNKWEPAMTDANIVDVNEIIDDQKIQQSTIVFLMVAMLAMVADGFDLAAIGFVAAELKKSWGIPSAQLAPIFSAGIIGLLIGAPLFGFLGDRFGRKTGILIGLCTFGVFTLITMMASSVNQFVALRFLTGLGLGGMIPNILSLVAEIAPKRFRGRFTIIVLIGVPLGISIPGIVAAVLVPRFGWPAILLVGGTLPLIVALAVAFIFKESLKFLVQRGGRDEDVSRVVRALRPDLSISSHTRFSVGSASVPVSRGSPARLFAGSLAVITPALWVALAANQFANFFALSWLPTFLQSSGLSTAQAGISASMFAIGGLAGGIILTFIIDRLGVLPIIGLFLLGAPLIASMGIEGASPWALGSIIAAAGFCVTGNNFAINAAMAMIYPTPIRATGTGWAQAMGRMGSMAAPILGGVLLRMHLVPRELYYAPALALLIGAVAAGLLVVFCIRRFGGYRLDEAAAVGATESSKSSSGG